MWILCCDFIYENWIQTEPAATLTQHTHFENDSREKINKYSIEIYCRSVGSVAEWKIRRVHLNETFVFSLFSQWEVGNGAQWTTMMERAEQRARAYWQHEWIRCKTSHSPYICIHLVSYVFCVSLSDCSIRSNNLFSFSVHLLSLLLLLDEYHSRHTHSSDGGFLSTFVCLDSRSAIAMPI